MRVCVYVIFCLIFSFPFLNLFPSLLTTDSFHQLFFSSSHLTFTSLATSHFCLISLILFFYLLFPSFHLLLSSSIPPSHHFFVISFAALPFSITFFPFVYPLISMLLTIKLKPYCKFITYSVSAQVITWPSTFWSSPISYSANSFYFFSFFFF